LTYNTYVEISGVAANGTSYSSGRAIVEEHGSVRYDVLPGAVHIYTGNGNLTSEAGATCQYITLATADAGGELPKTAAMQSINITLY